jgi:hypothetical protein
MKMGSPMKDRRSHENKGGPDERGDDVIRAGLAPLKGVGMPAHTRTATEKRIQTSLAGGAGGRVRFPTTWWRHRVSVPVPVAAGFVLFLVLLGILQLWQLGLHRADKSVATLPPGPAAAEVSKPEYYEQGLYVTGMGLVNSERGYRLLKESNHEI